MGFRRINPFQLFTGWQKKVSQLAPSKQTHIVKGAGCRSLRLPEQHREPRGPTGGLTAGEPSAPAAPPVCGDPVQRSRDGAAAASTPPRYLAPGYEHGTGRRPQGTTLNRAQKATNRSGRKQGLRDWGSGTPGSGVGQPRGGGGGGGRGGGSPRVCREWPGHGTTLLFLISLHLHTVPDVLRPQACLPLNRANYPSGSERRARGHVEDAAAGGQGRAFFNCQRVPTMFTYGPKTKCDLKGNRSVYSNPSLNP